MEISTKLKQIRVKLGYSQRWVNSYLGYNKLSGNLYKKEKGIRAFSITDIQKLCKLYKINANELLNFDEAVGGENDEERKN